MQKQLAKQPQQEQPQQQQPQQKNGRGGQVPKLNQFPKPPRRFKKLKQNHNAQASKKEHVEVIELLDDDTDDDDANDNGNNNEQDQEESQTEGKGTCMDDMDISDESEGEMEHRELEQGRGRERGRADDMDISTSDSDRNVSGSISICKSSLDADINTDVPANPHMNTNSSASATTRTSATAHETRALKAQNGDISSGEDNATKDIPPAQPISASVSSTRRISAIAPLPLPVPIETQPQSQSITNELQLQLLEKRERLKRALKKALNKSEIGRAKAQLAILQMQREEALKLAREQLLAAMQRKEGALKRKLERRNSSTPNSNVSGSGSGNVSLSGNINVTTDANPRPAKQRVIERPDDASRREKLPNLSAFTMQSLRIMNIGSQGTDDELVRHRSIESISILRRSSSVVAVASTASTGVPEADGVKSSEISICDNNNNNNESNVLSSNRVAKLKLDLELAKRRLKLAGLQKKRLEVQRHPTPVPVNVADLSNKDPAPAIDLQVQQLPQPDPVDSTDLLNKDPVIDLTEHFPAKPAMVTMQDLLKRQQELLSNIKASKEAHKELKDGQDISNLRQMIQKQQALLRQHGTTVTNCTESLQQCKTSLELEKKAKAQSEAILQDLLQRKAQNENMMGNVSRKIMKLRRKREKAAE